MEIADTPNPTAPRMEALDVLRLICDEQNSWMDAELVALHEQRDTLSAQLLPSRPRVIPETVPPTTPEETRSLLTALRQMREAPPRRRGGSPQRAMRAKSDPHPEGWGQGRE